MGVWRLLITAAAIFVAAAPPVAAATVSALTEHVASDVLIKGDIEPGDSERLVAWIRGRRFPPVALEIDSRGGSVAEAVRLAQVVRKLALSGRVSPNGVCASACFLLFVAGVGRSALPAELMSPEARERTRLLQQRVGGKTRLPGPVGLHRPFQTGLTSPNNQQGSVMRAVSQYLENQLVPRRLIDVMMSRPSTDVYWMTDDDLKELGEFPPDVEEFLIQKCNYDPRYIDKATAVGADSAAIIERANRASECVATETSRMHERGLQELKQNRGSSK